MDEKCENGGRYRLGRHWQTIQGSLFPEWEREMGRSSCAFMPIV